MKEGRRDSRKMNPNKNQLEYCSASDKNLSALGVHLAVSPLSTKEGLTLIPVAGGILIAPFNATGKLTQRTQLLGHRLAIIQVRMGPTMPMRRPQRRGL